MKGCCFWFGVLGEDSDRMCESGWLGVGMSCMKRLDTLEDKIEPCGTPFAYF